MKTRSDPSAPPLREQSLALFDPELSPYYSLEMVAYLAQVSRHRVALYCKHQFVLPLDDPAENGWFFDAQAIRTVRQLEGLRARFGVNLAGARLLWLLTQEVEQLHRDLRFFRES